MQYSPGETIKDSAANLSEYNGQADIMPPNLNPPPLKLRTGMPSPLWVEGEMTCTHFILLRQVFA